MQSIDIRFGELTKAVWVSHHIPEFDYPYPLDEYLKRTEGTRHHIATAYSSEHLAGFKVGYHRDNDGSFYSWMGGVLPEFRRLGIANTLAEAQEEWARKNGYISIRMKTRKKHKGMIRFSKNRGFIKIKTEQKTPDADSRVWMEKQL